MKHLPSGVVVQSQNDRSQWVNRQHCLHRLRKRLEALYARPAPRVATKPARRGRGRRLGAKKRRGAIKEQRGRVDWANDN